ncbi:MAG TPA: putative metal-dependent hydrolase [Chitinophagales bacterium]|nr:putative metal-dependent hydrolase [Chitinophagales bacterium]
MTDSEAKVTEEPSHIDKLRYPVGIFEYGKNYSREETQNHISKIEDFPARLKKLVTGMNDEQLDTPYRSGGWTTRQVIHHLPDSHMNAYIRFRLAITENKPTIKPYNEKAWADLEDVKSLPPSASLILLDGLHQRWTAMLRMMKEEDFQKTFFHPEHLQSFTLADILAMYAWHCDHHYEHINLVKKKFPLPSQKKTKKTSEPKSSTTKSSARSRKS